MKKLKVIQVIPTLDFGGIETHRFLIAKYHNPKDYNLSFCCLSNSGTTADKIEKLGYPITYFHENIKIPNVTLLVKLYKLFRQERPDVVHACAAEGNFHAIIAAYFAGVPIRIAEEVGLPSQSNKAKKVFRYVYSFASVVIGVSEKVSNYLLTENNVPSSKVKTIYNPFDIELYSNIDLIGNIKNKKFTIVSVGRLVHEKNHLFLIKSIKKVCEKYSNIQLNIVGDGILKKELEIYIKNHDLQDCVELMGFREDIPQILRKSDLFILPSKVEGLGIALIEAMATGVLVIGTDIGGIPEIIIRNEAKGWLVPSDDIESMSQTIDKVINLSEKEKVKIRNNAKAYVKTNFHLIDIWIV